MNAEENKRLTKMEQSVEEIKTDISVIKSALIGNELSGEGGVVGQVTALKEEVNFLKVDIRTLQEEKTKNSVYIKQLSYVIGIIVTGFIGGIVKYLFF